MASRLVPKITNGAIWPPVQPAPDYLGQVQGEAIEPVLSWPEIEANLRDAAAKGVESVRFRATSVVTILAEIDRLNAAIADLKHYASVTQDGS